MNETAQHTLASIHHVLTWHPLLNGNILAN